MHRMFVLAAAAFLIAAPLSLAQTNPPATPSAAAPQTTPAPSAQGAPAPAPAVSAAPAATPAPTASVSAAAPQGCRTRKAVGEACACLSDTSRIGTATAHPNGHNVCVRA